MFTTNDIITTYLHFQIFYVFVNIKQWLLRKGSAMHSIASDPPNKAPQKINFNLTLTLTFWFQWFSHRKTIVKVKVKLS